MGMCFSRFPDTCTHWRGGGRCEGRPVADPVIKLDDLPIFLLEKPQMRQNWYHSIVALALIALFAEVSWAQDKPTPGYNTKIPESIMTPNNYGDEDRHFQILRCDPNEGDGRSASTTTSTTSAAWRPFSTACRPPRWRRSVVVRRSTARRTHTRLEYLIS